MSRTKLLVVTVVLVGLMLASALVYWHCFGSLHVTVADLKRIGFHAAGDDPSVLIKDNLSLREGLHVLGLRRSELRRPLGRPPWYDILVAQRGKVVITFTSVPNRASKDPLEFSLDNVDTLCQVRVANLAPK
jgi:hypothetical protein